MTQALISVGSNKGDRVDYLNSAIGLLESQGILRNLKSSRFYQTQAVGITNQDDFLNCSIVGQTDLGSLELLCSLKEIEIYLGRIPRPMWHEREIDLDIILFGGEIINSSEICLPHPRMQDRNFVLFPSCEIAPNMIHPVFGKSILELATQCEDCSKFNIFNDVEINSVV